MTVHWLQPLAWWGLGLLALPVVIHLLARHRSRRMRFPSLKFLPVEQMAALRRRVITDWPLLFVRLLIVAAAVAALASPVFVSDARREAWDRRVARAIVLASPQTDEIRLLVAEEAHVSHASAEFSAAVVPDALRDAQHWLGEQAPAAREIVIVGDVREDALSEHDLARVPSYVGVRFLPSTRSEPRPAVKWRTVAEGLEGTPTAYIVTVTPDASRTRVQYEAQSGIVAERIHVSVGPGDQAHADAVLRAVLREGLVLGSGSERAVTIAFEGSALPRLDELSTPTDAWMRAALEQVPDVRGGELDGALVVKPRVAVTDARAPRIVSDVLRAAFVESRVELEPRRVSAATLAAWSRPYGASPPDARPADEGDRRWFWGAALMLLGLEHVLRGRRHVA